MIEAQKYFKEQGYVVLENFVPSPLINFIYEYSLLRTQLLAYKTSTKSGLENYNGNWDGNFDDTKGNFGSKAVNFYGDPLTETLMIKSLEDIQNHTGLELVPTYSFLRLYQEGDTMIKHEDRDSCEISVTICLGYSDNIWPIYLENRQGESIEVPQKPGDALIYSGCELPHWRDKLKKGHHSQTFIHYNRKNKINNNFRDGRPHFGVPKEI